MSKILNKPEPKLSRDVALISFAEQRTNCLLNLDSFEPLQLIVGTNDKTRATRDEEEVLPPPPSHTHNRLCTFKIHSCHLSIKGKGAYGREICAF
jgi:hypothetical protein